MPKLVRDKIPEIIMAEGKSPRYRVANADERWPLLLDKLTEEIEELRQAPNRAEAYEEMADVLEVVDAMRACFDVQKLDQTKALKAMARGRFKQNFVLEDPDG